MRAFEKQYGASYHLICGIDEAGRGPLAGPVVAGACILPKNCVLLHLNDSKKVSEKRREELFLEIQEKALAWSTGMADPQEIDRLNILNATYLAMQRAIVQLSPQPDFLLADAVTIPDLSFPQKALIHGDARSVSIAAGSILAKVTRDHLMLEYDRTYPGYGFAVHKGYGTREHYDAIFQLGPCPIHRRSFLKNLEEHKTRRMKDHPL